MARGYSFTRKTGGQEVAVRRVSPSKMPQADKSPTIAPVPFASRPREEIVADNRKRSTQAYVRHSEFGSPCASEWRATILTLALDKTLRNAEAARRAIEMVKEIERHARENGMERLETTETIISPRSAKKLGFTLTSEKRVTMTRDGKPYSMYRYSKKLN
ncbi:MAG: hypothetical protein AABW54_04020 [Candidatus Micrarchaeota archaeon]